ncbi:MAG TPA: DoxX family protein, partial [Bacteroidales bacterium]|nr:DoxX family protein [Bacteroidales bacterium]
MISAALKNRYIQVFIAVLRIAIGWQFLYEGMVKLLNPLWTARPFLEGSRWIFGDLFRWMISGETGMNIINAANAYGLTLIGIALILGIFTKLASWSGVTLLLMYYLAYPPFGGFSYGFPSEGSYLIVNKNLVELFALIILAMTNSGLYFGLDRLIKSKREASFKKSEKQDTSETTDKEDINNRNTRRELLKGLAGIPVLAAYGGAFIKNLSEAGPDAVSGATIKVDYKQIKDLKGKLPVGKLGNLTMSRMIMGCNLIGGWAHARDLIYANTLFKAYNNERKIIETFYLAERAGINTTFMVTQYYTTFNKYKSIYNGKMQSVCQAMLPDKDFYSDIKLAIDSGATAIYIQGGEGDRYMKAGKADMVFKAVDYIQSQGFITGLGCHSLESIKT